MSLANCISQGCINHIIEWIEFCSGHKRIYLYCDIRSLFPIEIFFASFGKLRNDIKMGTIIRVTRIRLPIVTQFTYLFPFIFQGADAKMDILVMEQCVTAIFCGYVFLK